MSQKLSLCLFVVFAILLCIVYAQVEPDRLEAFYQRLKESDVKYCSDKTRMLPSCTECIPGLQQGKNSQTCNEFIASSNSIRDEIKNLVIQRFGSSSPKNREFGLYPYLEKGDFIYRQKKFGSLISERTVKNVMDIGAYYNPINLFMTENTCPESMIIIEPILDPISAMVPCKNSDKSTHYLVLPITFRHYITIKKRIPMPETVVCIGCDSHYGPNRRMLETTFDRPYTLFIEYPSEYVHNAPFKKMNGDGPGEKLVFHHKFQAATNETIYTKRVMKVIEYTGLNN